MKAEQENDRKQNGGIIEVNSQPFKNTSMSAKGEQNKNSLTIEYRLSKNKIIAEMAQNNNTRVG